MSSLALASDVGDTARITGMLRAFVPCKSGSPVGDCQSSDWRLQFDRRLKLAGRSEIGIGFRRTTCGLPAPGALNRTFSGFSGPKKAENGLLLAKLMKKVLIGPDTGRTLVVTIVPICEPGSIPGSIYLGDDPHKPTQIDTGEPLMKKHKSVLAGIVLAAVAITLAQPVHAAAVSYTAGAVGPTQFPGPFPPPAGAPHLVDGEGYAGDAVGLASYLGSLTLTPGSSVQTINTLNWSVSYTYNGTDGSLLNDSPAGGDWPELDFPITLTRSLSFGGGPIGSISQTGLLRVTYEDDYLSLNAGGTSTFFVPGYQIDVTPLALEETNVLLAPGFPLGTPWIQADRDVPAQFVVTAVPEPSSLVLVLTAAIAAGVGAWRRRA